MDARCEENPSAATGKTLSSGKFRAAAAVLVWTKDGVLTAYDESFDTRCASESRCVVSDAWSERGYTYAHIAAVTAYLGGVELRASHQLYRMRQNGNELELIGVSAAPMARNQGVSTADTVYRIWCRQRPMGLTPDQGNAALDRQM